MTVYNKRCRPKIAVIYVYSCHFIGWHKRKIAAEIWPFLTVFGGDVTWRFEYRIQMALDVTRMSHKSHISFCASNGGSTMLTV